MAWQLTTLFKAAAPAGELSMRRMMVRDLIKKEGLLGSSDALAGATASKGAPAEPKLIVESQAQDFQVMMQEHWRAFEPVYRRFAKPPTDTATTTPESQQRLREAHDLFEKVRPDGEYQSET